MFIVMLVLALAFLLALAVSVLDDSDVVARVEHGCLLLDERAGPAWAWKINTDRLNLRSSRTCVLGQLYGTFHEGRLYLNLRFASSVDHGFVSSLFPNPALRAEWIKQIMQRRAVVTEA